MIAIVLIKQVAETPTQVEWNPETQVLNIEKATKILNPYQLYTKMEKLKKKIESDKTSVKTK